MTEDERGMQTAEAAVAPSFRWLTLERIVIISLPFMFFTHSTGQLHIAVADLVFPLLAFFTLVKPLSERQSRTFYPIALFVFAMLVVVTTSALNALLFDPGFNSKIAAQSTFKLLVVFSYVIVFAIRAASMKSDELCSLLRTWGWTATIISWATIGTAAGIADIVPVADDVRSLGFFQDANLYGGYLLLSLSIVVAADVMKPSHYWTIVQVLSIVAAILLTASRGALLSLGFVLVLGFLIIAKWKVRLIVGSIALGAGFLQYAFGYGPLASWLGPAMYRLSRSGQTVAEDARFSLWERAISLWNEHPLFGVGIGQFGRFSIDVNWYYVEGLGQVTHNTFLSFLVETGIFGLLLCIAGFGALTLRLYSNRQLGIRLRHAFAIGMLAICIEMFNLNLHNVRYVWIFVGLVWGYTVWKSQADRLRDRSQSSPQSDELSMETSAAQK
jgi:O-antigen ligase